MPTLQLEAVTGEKLRALKEVTDIVDTDGEVVGQYRPVVWNVNALCPWDPSITKQDLDRIAAELAGRSFAEIIADLERRSCTGQVGGARRSKTSPTCG
jgi:hypothetical protein